MATSKKKIRKAAPKTRLYSVSINAGIEPKEDNVTHTALIRASNPKQARELFRNWLGKETRKSIRLNLKLEKIDMKKYWFSSAVECIHIKPEGKVQVLF